jgi:hypothetical protein
MSEGNGNGFKFLGDIVSPDDIRVVVSGDGGNDRVFVFSKLDTVTYRRYQDILVGRAGRRKGDSWKATYFLFGKKCKDVEGLTEQEKQWLSEQNKSAKDILLSDTEYGVVIDQAIGGYLRIAIPDADDLKSTSFSG